MPAQTPEQGSDREAHRRTLCIDFDGVLYPYEGDWDNGRITGDPMPGAVAALRKLYAAGYDLVVHTTRCNDPEQVAIIREWLEGHGAPVIWQVTACKVPAIAYIDDRAVRFTNWPDIRKRFV